MADPRRWLDAESGASEEERALLRTARDFHPKPGTRDAVWSGVLAELAAAPVATPSVKPAVSSKISLKIVAGLIVVGLVAWVFFGRGPKPQQVEAPTASSPAVASTASAPIPAPSAATPSPCVPTAEPAAPAPSSVPQPVKVAPPPSASASSTLASRLREESELIGQARAALRNGDYAKAQSFLATAHDKFPSGVLVQERKALEIEVLVRTGKKAEAAAMADDFLNAYPNSPHAARIRELVKP
ncbi:MAG: outer membrane protein assembly factor BamD [Polyangiales bacterium]